MLNKLLLLELILLLVGKSLAAEVNPSRETPKLTATATQTASLDHKVMPTISLTTKYTSEEKRLQVREWTNPLGPYECSEFIKMSQDPTYNNGVSFIYMNRCAPTTTFWSYNVVPTKSQISFTWIFYLPPSTTTTMTTVGITALSHSVDQNGVQYDFYPPVGTRTYYVDCVL